MDKVKFFIILAIVVVVIVFVVDPGGILKKIISSIINGVGNAVRGTIAGAGEGLAKSVGTEGTTSESDANTYFLSNIAYLNNSKGNSSSPWNPDLYNNNQSASNLDYSTLKASALLVYDSLGTSIFGAAITHGDASKVAMGIFSCQTKVDVSNLSIVYKQEHGNDLLSDMITGPDNINNDYPAGNGQDNLEVLYNILKSVDALPTM